MKKKKYVLKPRFKIFLILFFLAYIGITMFKQQIKLNEQNNKIQALHEDIAKTEDRNEDLERMIQYTESEEYMEKMARERLGWVKKGEIIFIEKKNN